MNPLLPIFSFPRTQGFHPRTLALWLLSLFPWCCASSSFSSQNRSRCVNIKKLTRLSLTSSYLLIFRPRFCPLHWVQLFLHMREWEKRPISLWLHDNWAKEAKFTFWCRTESGPSSCELYSALCGSY